MNRRQWLLACAATAMSASAPLAMAAGKPPIRLGKIFSYLDMFLKIPLRERDRFVLAYYLTRDKRPATDVRAYVVDGASRTPIPLAPDGRVLRLPTLAQLQGEALFQAEVPEEAKLGMTLELHAATPPATRIDARELDLSLQQVSAVIRKRAGLLGFIVPKITQANFPGAGSGAGVLADGRTLPLPTISDGPYYDPSAMPGVQVVMLDRTPSKIVLDTRH